MPGTVSGHETGTGGAPDLTDFQLEVAQLFFSLPGSKGFLLAGGAALLAQHLTTRPTEDLDFFTSPERGHVPAARDALEAAARERGWSTERIHDSDTFCRLVIRSDTAEVLTDLAVDAPPDFPASPTAAGPTLAPEELAGHKLLALFDRAAARDFTDVRLLARRFGKDVLLARAAQIDAGFDAGVLAADRAAAPPSHPGRIRRSRPSPPACGGAGSAPCSRWAGPRPRR
jgi:Nucleotidyl transferase AbiEii toxin, Type IV TA system